LNILTCDPDTREPAFCLGTEEGEILAIGALLKIKESFHPVQEMMSGMLYNYLADFLPKGVTVGGIVIEKPVASRERTPDPNPLIDLGLVGGLVAGILQPADVILVEPEVWKGQVSKILDHERTLDILEWSFTRKPSRWQAKYSRQTRNWTDLNGKILPVKGHITPTQWEDILDAIGIFLYAVGKK